MTARLDHRGCPISGATPGALQAYERALAASQSWHAGAETHLADALAEAPHFVMAHALAAYLRQALQNRIRDEVRKVHVRPGRESLDDGTRDAGASPLEEAIGSEALQRYEAALARLPEADRELVLARVEMGLSYAEVAASTERPSADAARMAVGRALVRLAEEMDRA